MLPAELTLLDGTDVVTLERGAELAQVPLHFVVRSALPHATTLGGVRYYRRAAFDPALWAIRVS